MRRGAYSGYGEINIVPRTPDDGFCNKGPLSYPFSYSTTQGTSYDHHHRENSQQRRERRGAAGRTASADRDTGGCQVPVAGNLQVGKRHPQSLQYQRIFRAWRGTQTHRYRDTHTDTHIHTMHKHHTHTTHITSHTRHTSHHTHIHTSSMIISSVAREP